MLKARIKSLIFISFYFKNITQWGWLCNQHLKPENLQNISDIQKEVNRFKLRVISPCSAGHARPVEHILASGCITSNIRNKNFQRHHIVVSYSANIFLKIKNNEESRRTNDFPWDQQKWWIIKFHFFMP